MPIIETIKFVKIEEHDKYDNNEEWRLAVKFVGHPATYHGYTTKEYFAPIDKLVPESPTLRAAILESQATGKAVSVKKPEAAQ